MSEDMDTSSFLFPAYAPGSSKSDTQGSHSPQPGWLINESFPTGACSSLQQTQNSYTHVEEEDECEYHSESDSADSLPDSSNTYLKEKIYEKPESGLIQEGSFLRTHLKNVIFLEDTGLSDERAFRVDTKYDGENLAFLALDPKTLPRYWCQNVVPLGICGADATEWLQSNESKKKPFRYFTTKKLKTVEDSSEDCVPVVDKKELPEVLPNYLSFCILPKKDIVNVSSMECFEGVSCSWKAKFGKSAATQSHSSMLLPETIHEGIDKKLQEKIVYFNRAVTESVHDEKLWLDFVDFQHELFRSPAFSKHGSVNEKTLIEKQIAILDRALKFNPNSIKLSIAKLKLLRTVKEKEEVFSAWEKFIFYFPNNSTVWQHYLNFVLTDVTYFNISLITKLYHKCLQTLNSVLEGELKSHLPPPGLSLNMIDVFSNFCAIALCSGHQETAVAVFQAFLEFTFFPPKFVLDAESSSQQVPLFEPFWDSGVPRLGEENAIGWSRTVTEKKIVTNVKAAIIDLTEKEDQILLKSLPKYETWCEFEMLRMLNYFLPWRPDLDVGQTNEDLDDPERIVTFDHVSRFLFIARNENERFYLLCQYVSSFGVNMHSIGCPMFAGEQEQNLCCFEDFNLFLECLANSFPDKNVPDILRLKNYRCTEAYSDLVGNIFPQVIDTFSSEYKTYVSFLWLRYQMAKLSLEFSGWKRRCEGFGAIKKFAKNLLKRPENRNSLFLWNMYLEIEELSGFQDKARQTFETLLTSSTSASSFDESDCRTFRYFSWNYIKLYFLKEDSSAFVSEHSNFLVWIMCRVIGKQKYSAYRTKESVAAALVMKAVSECRKEINREVAVLSEDDHIYCSCLKPMSQSLLTCVDLGAYFLYLVKGVDAAVKQFEDVLTQLKGKFNGKELSKSIRFLLEQITVHKAELLNFHLLRMNKSLEPLQTFLYDAVEEFPSNALLLHMLVRIKCAVPVVGPTRRFFYKLVKSSTKLTPITWLFAIVSELIICYRHQEPMIWSGSQLNPSEERSMIKTCGILWQVRSLFDSALKCRASAHCVALWRSCIKFEILNDDISRARSMFYQALQSCPWSKALYLDGISYFPDQFDNLMCLMSEKELRIHTPPEEVDLLMKHALKPKE